MGERFAQAAPEAAGGGTCAGDLPGKMRNTQKLRENALFLSLVREDACQAPERGFGRTGRATGARDGHGGRAPTYYHLLPLGGALDPPSHKHYPVFLGPDSGPDAIAIVEL